MWVNTDMQSEGKKNAIETQSIYHLLSYPLWSDIQKNNNWTMRLLYSLTSVPSVTKIILVHG